MTLWGCVVNSSSKIIRLVFQWPLIFAKFRIWMGWFFKIFLNLRKNQETLVVKIWSKIGQIGIWICHFFLKNCYMYGSTFNSKQHTPTKSKLQYPLVKHALFSVYKIMHTCIKRIGQNTGMFAEMCYYVTFILKVGSSLVMLVVSFCFDHSNAEKHLKRALSMRESLLPEEHLDIVQSLNNLAALYNDAKDYQKAESFYERALLIRKSILPADHPTVVSSVRNLGMLYRKQVSFGYGFCFKTNLWCINLSKCDYSSWVPGQKWVINAVWKYTSSHD